MPVVKFKHNCLNLEKIKVVLKQIYASCFICTFVASAERSFSKIKKAYKKCLIFDIRQKSLSSMVMLCFNKNDPKISMKLFSLHIFQGQSQRK